MSEGDPFRVDVMGIGVAVRDLSVLLDHHPAPDEKMPVEDFTESDGGPVPGALVTLSRFGLRCGIVGLVGDDAAGAFVRAGLEREGVSTAGLRARVGFATPTSIVLVAGEHRTICEFQQAKLPLRADALRAVPGWTEHCSWLLVDGRMPDLQAEAARRVRAAGGRVLLDAGHWREGAEGLLPLVDVAILSHTYPATVPDGPFDPGPFTEQLPSRLDPRGLGIAGITLGEKGCVICTRGGPLVRVPGFPIDVVDTTGAGDVFHGAFVYALQAGDDPVGAARFANAAAALKCRGRTSRAPLPPVEQIRRFAGAL